MATKSLTTADQFIGQIADLPLVIVERTRYGGLAMMPRPQVAPLTDDERDLFHALEIRAGKRGLRVHKGFAVWTVNGLAR